MKKPLEFVRDLYHEDGTDALWKWAVIPDGPHGKAKRFRILAIFAKRQKESAHGKDKQVWAEREKVYSAESDKWEKKYELRHTQAKWPQDLVVTECLYHDPPHFHLASPEREKLIVVCGIIEAEFNCRIGEFPPFDTVENVHVGPSWHYRDPARPYTPVAFSASKLVKGGPWGCAADMNDKDGGSDQEYAAFIEVRRRYVLS